MDQSRLDCGHTEEVGNSGPEDVSMGSVDSDGDPSEGIQVEKNRWVGWSGWPQDVPSRVAKQGSSSSSLSIPLIASRHH